MPEKKYVVLPGWVMSKNDRDRHFISAAQLIHLYGVDPAECVIGRDAARGYKALIELTPRFHGDYTLG